MKKSRLLGAVCVCAMGVLGTAQSATISLSPTTGGYIVDNTSDGSPDVATVSNFLNVLNRPPPNQEERGFVEFDLASIPNDVNSISLDMSLFQNTGATWQIQTYGYTGDGILSLSDWNAGALVNSTTYASESFSLDVTSFINSRILAGDSYVGFGLRVPTQQAGRKVYSDAMLNVDFTSAVPIPPTVWLFGSGLLGLVGMARRKKS